MPPCLIDHLVIAAPTLEQGAAWVRQALGVPLQPGGQHGRMGTHNQLLRLGGTSYLEVIASDPAAPAPGRPRWFALDHLAPGSAPRLAAWVARTDDIQAALAAAGEPLGEIEAMSRGTLDWLITVPADGIPPLGCAAPALIQWRTGGHPADRLEDQGLALARLEIVHPQPARIERLLSALALQGPVTVTAAAPGEAPHLVAHIDTPLGRRRLPAG